MIRLLTCALVCASGAFSQQFEVASIKPSNADPRSSGMNTGNGRVDGNNVTLKRCIMGAYSVGPNQVVGGPDWLDSDRWEIAAKVEEPVGDRALMVLLQGLLADRFKLTLHREGRPIQAYVLEVAKVAAKLERGDGGQAKTDNGRGNITATNATMDRFAEILSRQMDLPVVNRTGLEGAFNLKLQWTPEGAKAANAAVDGLSIFTAMQEQLGLRMRAQKVPVEVLVIDHVEKPTEN